MELTREQPTQAEGLLYPMMVIAVIAVIAFSVVGIASIAGWMPSSLIGSAHASTHVERGFAESTDAALPVTTQPGAAAFECTECGVIETVREIERRGGLGSEPLAQSARPAAVTL